eukprot:TRINITY_DN30842_c0_g2_i1.p1 TRINITY_DN30842_c0_g2~~TRINITY_DN30842_c0_g2_i1.p1  ORF type:complete len:147 (-),score=5.95 TRINITY_DN30842_c0_g2_i1:35-475(-)
MATKRTFHHNLGDRTCLATLVTGEQGAQWDTVLVVCEGYGWEVNTVARGMCHGAKGNRRSGYSKSLSSLSSPSPPTIARPRKETEEKRGRNGAMTWQPRDDHAPENLVLFVQGIRLIQRILQTSNAHHVLPFDFAMARKQICLPIQ